MDIRVFKDYEKMSIAAAEAVISRIRHKPDRFICLPSGDTPTRMLQLLVDAARDGKVSFRDCHFVGLDEWVGMDRSDAGSCQHYLYTHFLDPAGIGDSRITFFNAKAPDLERECAHIHDVILKRGPVDIMVLGVGLNGHLGLNEPGTAFSTTSHVTDLHSTTRVVAGKYFSSPKQLTRGVTLGIKDILDAKTVLLLASGPKKAGIAEAIVKGPIATSIPASVLQRHNDCTFYLDDAAAEKLFDPRQ